MRFIVCNPREENGLYSSISEFFDNFSRCHPDCECFLGDRTFRHLSLNDGLIPNSLLFSLQSDEICIQTIYPIEIESEIAKEVFSIKKPDDLTGKCFQLSMYIPGLESKNVIVDIQQNSYIFFAKKDLFSPLMKQFFITSTFYSAVNEEETKAPAHFYPTPMVVSSIALRRLTSRLIHETESLKLILQAFSECETKKDKNRIREQLQRRFHEILFPTLNSGAIFDLNWYDGFNARYLKTIVLPLLVLFKYYFIASSFPQQSMQTFYSAAMETITTMTDKGSDLFISFQKSATLFMERCKANLATLEKVFLISPPFSHFFS